MGHVSIQMTYDVYGFLLDRVEDDGEAMAQMQTRLFGEKKHRCNAKARKRRLF
jgi:hypothetical protein